MAGIVVDAKRHKKTRDEFFNGLFGGVRDYFSPSKEELKSTKLFYGKDKWHKMPIEERYDLIRSVASWAADRKHKVIVAAIDKERAETCTKVDDVWLGASLHVALQSQRLHAPLKSKGRTILVFDDNRRMMPRLSDLLWEPPPWTDDFYGRKAKDPALDLIVDSAFAVNSQHAGPVQIADMYAFLFRRYSELSDYGLDERFRGEGDLVEECLSLVRPRVIEARHRYPKRTEAGGLFASLAPESILKL